MVFHLTKFDVIGIMIYVKLFVTDGSGLPQGSRKYFADRLGVSVPFERTVAAFFGLLHLKGLILLMRKIGILMGSDSDLPVVEKAIDTLKDFGVPYEVHVFSAHRTPVEAAEFSKNARKNGFGAIIAAAGMAAHLAGAVAANTTLPVVGIPVKSASLDGMDALLSTVMMPPGIPVATVGINGAANAALLCIEILSVEDEALAQKLTEARVKAAQKVLEKNKAVEEKYNN